MKEDKKTFTEKVSLFLVRLGYKSSKYYVHLCERTLQHLNFKGLMMYIKAKADNILRIYTVFLKNFFKNIIFFNEIKILVQ